MTPGTVRQLAMFMVVALWATAASAADLILRPQPSVDPAIICARYGFSIQSALDTQHLYLAWGPDTLTQADLDAIVAGDHDIQGLEFSRKLQAPSVPGEAALTQSIAGVLESYTTNYVNYYGASAWDYYVTQSATSQLRLADARNLATGAGTIAIIDTGVDPTHPALQNALVPGYDFTRDIDGYGSELTDVADLTQSIAGVLETYATDVWAGLRPPPPLPAFFGHGTMVAGIIHLTAPTSKLMPLKAFSADGSTTLYNIIRAIYYAADHGAKVINMSFITFTPSKELSQALQYANKKNIIAIAAVGNNGVSTDAYPVYPADYRVSFGIGSLKSATRRSDFSNYGADVKVAAPGEALLTTYPGDMYAAVWGTSFSAGWASGSVALFAQRNQWLSMRDVDAAFSIGSTKLKSSEGMGAGKLDIYKALASVPVR